MDFPIKFHVTSIYMGDASGSQAGAAAAHNTAMGTYALQQGKGAYNCAFGAEALGNDQFGENNVAVGAFSMMNNDHGYENTAVGYRTLFNCEIAAFNTAVGSLTLYSLTGGYENTCVGNSSGYNLADGIGNTALGNNSLYNNVSGNENTAIGSNALLYSTFGNNNTAIGSNAGVSQNFPNLHNTTAIGAGATVEVDNGVVLGTNHSFVGIRQNAPKYALHIENAYCDGNTWFNASDRNLKENFRALSNESILDKVMKLKIEKWNYIGEKGASHIGPTAQDFNKVFNLGGNDKVIASVDEAGVALAAIQELNRKTEALQQLVEQQQQVISALIQTKVESDRSTTSPSSTAKLHQNAPNPFQVNTSIMMEIPDNVQHAILYVYDLQGKQVKKYNVPGRGTTNIVIEGGHLAAGIYLYTLIADGNATETKRMLLTE